MARKQMLMVVPMALVLGMGGKLLLLPQVTRGASERIADSRLEQMEAKLGHHLYAPTWLPHGGRVGTTGVMRGARRILQDFSDNQERSLCILSQEPRTQQRDQYHTRIFSRQAEASGDVNGSAGYFITGDTGERRLFWNQKDMAVILSSCVLSDEEMLRVARAVR